MNKKRVAAWFGFIGFVCVVASCKAKSKVGS